MNKEISFSENEYVSIRTEMIERIKLLNSQSFTALATIISFWAAGFTFKMSLVANNGNFSNSYEVIVMDFLSAIVFLMPVFLFVPLSVKSGENLSQIASISAYIKVFFDYPISKDKNNKNWETSNNLLSNANVDRKYESRFTRLYNSEYTILSCISFTIYFIFQALNIKNAVMLLQTQKINCLILHIFIIVYIAISALAVFTIIVIHKTSSMKNSLMRGTIYYTQGYIKRANELGLISDYDMGNALKELNPKKKFTVEEYYTRI